MLAKSKAAAATYSFSSHPKAVAGGPRKKFRDPNEAVDTTLYRDAKETCITWDRRVHRGNTYSMYTQNAIKEALELAENPPAPPPRIKKRPKERSIYHMGAPPPEQVPVDLTGNLIAKEEAPVTECVEAQTDEFLPEPPAEQYQPPKTGIDVSTQVEDGELFSFDYEVDPILDVLINKTLEQSIMEVEEEFEMERMHEFKVEWFQRQEVMMKDWDAQVSEEWVRWHEKEEVVKQKREEKRREAQVLLKIQAIAAAKAHLRDVVPKSVGSLTEVAFPDARGVAIDRVFLPTLLGQVQEEVRITAGRQRLVQEVIGSCVEEQAAAGVGAQQRQAERRHELAQLRHEQAQIRRGNIRIYIDAEDGRKVPVGPIRISSDEPIEDVHSRVFEWLQANEPTLIASFPHGVVLCLLDVPVAATPDIFEAQVGQITMRPAPPPEPEDTGEDRPGTAADEDQDGADGSARPPTAGKPP